MGLCALGEVHLGAGARRNALRQYTRALFDNFHFVPALYKEAILFTARNAPLAIFYYRKVIQIEPDSPTAHLNLGLLENQTKVLHRVALMDPKQVIRLDPASRRSRYRYDPRWPPLYPRP